MVSVFARSPGWFAEVSVAGLAGAASAIPLVALALFFVAVVRPLAAEVRPLVDLAGLESAGLESAALGAASATAVVAALPVSGAAASPMAVSPLGLRVAVPREVERLVVFLAVLLAAGAAEGATSA